MSEEVLAPDPTITKYTCKIKNKLYDVSLTNDEFKLTVKLAYLNTLQCGGYALARSYLKWYITGTENKDLETVRVVDILSASLKKSTGSSTDDLCVTYVKQEKKFILNSCSVTFTSDDSQIIQNLHQQISTLIDKNTQRPRKLLVLVNPVSGNSIGRQTYEQKAAPIFKEAGIETDVIVTEKAHHPEEILSTYDIKSIDGLVLVGGDGIYHEGVNGLMRRLTTERGLNADDPDESLPAFDIKIGLIPCGTGNVIAKDCYGSHDVKTAALAIAIGYRSPANMMSVHSDGKLVAYSTLVVGYGVFSDLAYTTESRRTQGRIRYPIALFEQMFIKTLRRMQLTIQYEHKEPQPHESAAATTACDADTVADGDNEVEDNIKEIGRDSHVAEQRSITIQESAIGSMLFTHSPGSLTTPKQDLSKAVIYVNKSPLRRKYISFLYQIVTLNFAALEARPDICVLPGQQWKVKLDEQSKPDTQNYELEHCVNIDGEVFRLRIPEYQVKLLKDKVKLYSNMPYATKRNIRKT